ncbi:MAG: ferritin-like domain-containing protein [Ilumatobacteraceae bacterium]
MNSEVRETTIEPTDVRLGRRAMFGAGIGGAAVSLLPLLTGKSAASSTSDDSTTTTAAQNTAPTTTAPPRRPTSSDVELLGAEQKLELTARALYDDAIDAGDWSDTEASVIATIREAHEAAAQALAGLLGTDAPGEMSQSLYASLSSRFTGSVSSRLEAAYELESALVASHTAALADLQGIDGATLIAAVQSAEARHGTVLADLNGQTVVSTLLVQDEAAALDVTA